MNKHDTHPWGPKDELGRAIGKIPYRAPNANLVGRIMSSLKPMQPGLGRRLLNWLAEPLTFRISPVLAALAMFFISLPGGYALFYIDGNASKVANGVSHTGVIPVVFNYKSKDAKTVAIIGSFNNWDPKGHDLIWLPKLGHWSLQLNLPPGKHDYVFLVNGEKVYPDPEADLIQLDDFGNRNSVLFVKGQNGIQI